MNPNKSPLQNKIPHFFKQPVNKGYVSEFSQIYAFHPRPPLKTVAQKIQDKIGISSPCLPHFR